MKILKVVGIVVLVIILVAAVGPFLVPVPALTDTVNAADLADADSLYIKVNGINFHYKRMGQGEPVMFLLHGFGASLFSWREVMEPLSHLGTVIAYDRPAFGLTDRPLPGEWSGENPYSFQAQVDQLFGLMDALGVKQAILVGNSAGGTVATAAALAHPERISKLVLVDAAIYAGSGGPGWIRLLAGTPEMNHLGPLIVRSIQSSGLELIKTAWHDPSKLTQAVFDGYTRPLKARNWDRALWELTHSSNPPDLVRRLTEIKTPTLVITGDDDRIVPTAQSLRLAKEIPGAELVVITAAGHVPQEEKPQEFIGAVQRFISKGS
jgi:pimeloyl-ACP methyl ester carboxylesterase